MLWKKRTQSSAEDFKFDPKTQYAVIRSSICTGEKVAGFKNKRDGHFTEVMVIRTAADEQRFKDLYGIDRLCPYNCVNSKNQKKCHSDYSSLKC